MSKVDLSILKESPQLNTNAELRIEPLAPLSMVSELPGSFYKTTKNPNKKMICGLLENILGWHIDCADRITIVDDYQKYWKKKKIKVQNYVKGSTFIPLLMDYFDIRDEIKVEFSEVNFFDDYWSRLYRRNDAVVHPKGTENIDYQLLPKKWKLKRDDKEPQKVDNNALEVFFKENIGNFPMYYSTPTIREYIHLNGVYIVPLLIDNALYKMLELEIEENNIGYLGNSEGWINLKLTRI